MTSIWWESSLVGSNGWEGQGSFVIQNIAFRMAEESTSRTSSASDSSQSIENLVRRVVTHPRFQEAVTSGGNSASLFASTGTDSGRRDVATTAQSARSQRDELQALFRRGASSHQQNPPFRQRTSWRGQTPTSRSGGRKHNPYGKSAKGKSFENTTFCREVVLLKHPEDSTIVRGAAKAELQRIGHVMSSFEFNKLWSSDEIMDKLEDAFSSSLGGAVNSEPGRRK